MAQPSAIEGHPQQHRIIEMLLAGASLRKIGSSVVPNVSHTTIRAYKLSKTSEELQNQLIKRNSIIENGVALQLTSNPDGSMRTVQAAPLEMHKVRLLNDLGFYGDSAKGRLRKSKTDNGVATLVNAGRGVVETEARLLGLLQEQANPTILILNTGGGNVTIGAPASAGPTQAELEDTSGLIDVAPDDDIGRR
jgi:hypothetical protein